ncbi:MAG: hypothetical protein IJ308_02630 [Clostridia bacterium]|nr:hypothetical protein [Clostridia bacterium]
MDETTVKKCPQCGSIVVENNLFCAACGYKLREKTENDLTEAEKAKRDENEYIEAKKTLSSSMNAISIIQTIAYYAIYAGFIVLLLFGFGIIGKKMNFNLLSILYHPTFLALFFASYIFVLSTIDCIGLHIGIKTVKEYRINVKRFAKVSLVRLVKMKAKKNMFQLVEFTGSAINIKTTTKNATLSDEARACRIVLAAATPEIEKRFRVELLIRQLLLIVASVVAVFLYAPLGVWFQGLGMFAYFVQILIVLGIISLSGIASMIISLKRIKMQEEWFNSEASDEVVQESRMESVEGEQGFDV